MNNSTNKLFAKLGHGFADDPKIIGLSDRAFRVYVESLLYACSNMTDGFLDERVLRRYGWLEAAEELTSNDAQSSWAKVDGGYQIYAFCDWQMTAEKHAEITKKRSEAGVKSGAVRREKNKQRTSVQQVFEQNANKNELEKEVEIEKEIELKHMAITSPLFDEFWQLWPRSDGKANALKAWQKAIKKIPAIDLVEAARNYSQRSDLPERKFIPHAATWLNGERWNDEPEPAKYDPDAWMNQDVKWGDARFEDVKFGDNE